jgi:V8-like Glu-specific endopeptidase
MIAGLSPRVLALSAGAASAFASIASGQMAPPPSHQVPWATDSGLVLPMRGAQGYTVVYSTTVFVPQAQWLRLSFGASQLPGRVEEGRATHVRITSLHDGAVQHLNAETIAQWANTSAYFNGDAVRVELLAYPGTGPSKLEIRSVTAGEISGGTDTICGPTDDRTLSSDPRGSRHLPEGCSTWLFNDHNRTFLTAGHCGISAGDVQQFNVPLSTSGGGTVNPAPLDQYPVDSTTTQLVNGGVGNDSCYFACFTNTETGMTAYQKQQSFYTLATTPPAVAGQTIRIYGYGTTNGSTAPLTWSQVQKVHSGPYSLFSGTTIRYQVDTTGGNSGSAVEDLATGNVIGIHTHAGCSNPTGTSSNQGTGINLAFLQTSLGAPRTLCLTGKGVVTPPLYAIGDGQNNFGTLNMATGNFAKIDFAGVRMEGLAYNKNIGLFYAINNDTNPASLGKRLYTVHPTTGAMTTLGLVTGIADPINGLGYDAAANILYGVAQATGQLVTINTSTCVATPIGPTNPGRTIGALEFRAADNALYGIDDAGGASKLVKWTTPTAAAALVGSLGAGIADCNGLGVTDNGDLWTINAGNEQLLRINAATGAATVVGATGGIFGASSGISAVLTGGPQPCYANCDGTGGLTGNDFQCFLNAYAAGQSYANCDGVGGLTANDFSCFLNAYAAGCS